MAAIVLLAIASAAIHGLVLSLPMPSRQPLDEPKLPTLPSSEEIDVDVTILPRGTLDSLTLSEEVTETVEDDLEQRQGDPEVERDRAFQDPPPEPEPDPIPPDIEIPPEEIPPEDDDVPPEPPLDLSANETPAEPPVDPEKSPASNPQPSIPQTLDEQLQELSAYQYESGGILSDGETSTELLLWVAPGQIFPSKVAPMEVPYFLPSNVCLESPPVPGTLVAIVNPDGTFERGPEMLSSTGYVLLDDKAIAMVETGEYAFPESTETQAYSVPVDISYPAECS